MKYTAALFGCLAFSAPAFAANGGASAIPAANNLIYVQRISTKVDYTETGSGYLGTRTGILDTETGPVTGMALSVSRMKGPENIYYQAGLDYSNGYTTYIGSFQGGIYGSVVALSSAMLMNYHARIGKGYALHGPFMLTPFLELGGHAWDRGVNYGELYTHYHFGAGLMGQYTPAANVVLTATLLYGQTFGSNIRVNGGPMLGGFSAALGNSLLSRIGVAADYAFTNQVHGMVSLDHMGFSYGMSAPHPVGGGFVSWEPDSKTRYTLLKIGVGMAF